MKNPVGRASVPATGEMVRSVYENYENYEDNENCARRQPGQVVRKTHIKFSRQVSSCDAPDR